MQYISLILSVFACAFSYKLLKETAARKPAPLKNQSVIDRISNEREVVYCVIKYYGDEVPHVLIDRRDYSVIRPDPDFDTIQERRNNDVAETLAE